MERLEARKAFFYPLPTMLRSQALQELVDSHSLPALKGQREASRASGSRRPVSAMGTTRPPSAARPRPRTPGKLSSMRTLEWLPPSALSLLEHEPDAVPAAQDALMHDYMRESDERAVFNSSALFLEVRLRQVLAASVRELGKPDRFRTAAVCDCLGRLAEAQSSFRRILQLLHEEVLHAVYADAGTRLPEGRPVAAAPGATALLGCTTFFARAEALAEDNRLLGERLASFERSRLELQQEAEGRAEMLRLALERWNGVMGALQQEGRVPQETNAITSKLGALLVSIEQHCKAVDDLQAIALIDPVTRLSMQIGGLGSTLRHQLLSSVVDKHGRGYLSKLSQEGRKSTLVALLSGVPLAERQKLLSGVVCTASVCGSTVAFLDSVAGTLGADGVVESMRRQAARCSSLLGEAAAQRVLMLLREALLPKRPATSEACTQTGERMIALQQAAAAIGPHTAAALESVNAQGLSAVAGSSGVKGMGQESAPLLAAMEARCAALQREAEVARAESSTLRDEVQRLRGRRQSRVEGERSAPGRRSQPSSKAAGSGSASSSGASSSGKSSSGSSSDESGSETARSNVSSRADRGASAGPFWSSTEAAVSEALAAHSRRKMSLAVGDGTPQHASSGQKL